LRKVRRGRIDLRKNILFDIKGLLVSRFLIGIERNIDRVISRSGVRGINTHIIKCLGARGNETTFENQESAR
jgi:hypothetical protein